MKIVALLPARNPSTELGVIKPLAKLQDRGALQLDVFFTDRDVREPFDHIASADAVVFYRNTEPHDLKLLHRVQAHRVPYIYGLDDNFFRIPSFSPIGAYHRAPHRIYTCTTFIRHAALVRTHNPVLAQEVRAFNPSIREDNAPFDAAFADLLPRESHDGVRIVYATSRVDDPYQSLFMPSLTRLLKERRTGIEVFFFGARPRDPALMCHPQVRHIESSSYDEYLRVFCRLAPDIGLAPLTDDVFSNSKTNNKYREYGGCRVAGIYSDTPLYRSCVRNNETGLLVANSPAAWFTAMNRLITSREHRNRIATCAFHDVAENYAVASFIQNWASDLAYVTASRCCPTPWAAGCRLVKRTVDVEMTPRVALVPEKRLYAENMLAMIGSVGVRSTVANPFLPRTRRPWNRKPDFHMAFLDASDGPGKGTADVVFQFHDDGRVDMSLGSKTLPLGSIETSRYAFGPENSYQRAFGLLLENPNSPLHRP